MREEFCRLYMANDVYNIISDVLHVDIMAAAKSCGGRCGFLGEKSYLNLRPSFVLEMVKDTQCSKTVIKS